MGVGGGVLPIVMGCGVCTRSRNRDRLGWVLSLGWDFG